MARVQLVPSGVVREWPTDVANAYIDAGFAVSVADSVEVTPFGPGADAPPFGMPPVQGPK